MGESGKKHPKWIEIRDVDGLTVSGHGLVDGRGGSGWWERSYDTLGSRACIFKLCDDCISIGDGTTDVNISDIYCGPGHGISVGSLGKNGGYNTVENIQVNSVQFNGTTNGARIKTWVGGSGHARSITFANLSFNGVKNPIIIGQHYHADSPSKSESQGSSAVEISDIKYIGAAGTSLTNVAVTFNCSQILPCSSLLLNNVNLTLPKGGPATSTCSHAKGKSEGYISPSVPCLH